MGHTETFNSTNNIKTSKTQQQNEAVQHLTTIKFMNRKRGGK